MEDVLYTIFFTVLFIYGVIKNMYRYWDRNGFLSVKASIPFGNFNSFMRKQRSFSINLYELYSESLLAPYIGVYILCRPALLIRHPSIVKRVLTSDAVNFRNKLKQNNVNLVLNHEVFMVDQTEFLRKNMELIIEECKRMTEHLQRNKIATDSIIDIHQIAELFSLTTISSLLFGTDLNLWENSKNPFVEYVRSDQNSFSIKMIQLSNFFSPRFRTFLKPQTKDTEIKQFFINQTRKYFKSKNSSENELYNIEEVADQTFTFCVSCASLISTTTAFCLYELASNKSKLSRLYQEIQMVLNKCNGRISYEDVESMAFLELCIKETMRLYPNKPYLHYECINNYEIEETKQLIKGGTPLLVSVLGLHRDCEYFKEPEKFIPERFLQKNEYFVTQEAYLASYNGGNSCEIIENRIGNLVTKVALINLLSKFDPQIKNNDEPPVLLNPNSKVYLKLLER